MHKYMSFNDDALVIDIYCIVFAPRCTRWTGGLMCEVVVNAQKTK